MEPYWVRGIRGATTVEADESELILEATEELLVAMLDANGIESYECIAAIFFTTTPDLVSVFPAEAARKLGMNLVPLLCNQEIPVPGRLTHVIRVLMQVNTRKRLVEMKHIYLHRASSLRPDLVSAQ